MLQLLTLEQLGALLFTEVADSDAILVITDESNRNGRLILGGGGMPLLLFLERARHLWFGIALIGVDCAKAVVEPGHGYWQVGDVVFLQLCSF